MIRTLLFALAALALPTCSATPALAQGAAKPAITGCGTLAVPKSDRTNAARLRASIACLEQVGPIARAAIDARLELLAKIAPTPTPTPSPAPTPSPSPTPAPAEWVACAGEWGMCELPGEAEVRFGASGRFFQRTIASARVACSNAAFGDPTPGLGKACEYRPTGRPTTDAGEAAPPREGEVTSSFGPPPGATQAVIAKGDRAWPVPTWSTSRRALLGVNIAASPWWGGDQPFANLLMGGEWRDFTRAELGADGYPRPELIRPERPAYLVLTPPYPSFTRDVPVHCTFEGTGDVTFEGNTQTGLRREGRAFDFTWTANTDNQKMVWVKLIATDPRDPVRNIDCRAEGVATTGIFTQQLVDYYRLFGTLRFLDPSNVNGNGAWRWSSRTAAADITQGGDGGWALETMLALTAATGTDGWYNVSWNADEDFQRRMAQLVHDGTPASRRVYVELSNEVWNFSFGVASQARDEGAALNMPVSNGDPYKAGMVLYAKRTADLMRIWTEVFRDRPGQLVRVAAGPADNAWYADVILGESGLAASGLVDVYAIAPYFGHDVLRESKGVSGLDPLFAKLTAHRDVVLKQWIPTMKGSVNRYGLPLIFYEAGQHLVDGEDGARLTVMNRDVRMGAAYADYLPRALAANGGTPMMLFNATGRSSKWGAWGLRETAGQPLVETPKLQAVIDFLANDNAPFAAPTAANDNVSVAASAAAGR